MTNASIDQKLVRRWTIEAGLSDYYALATQNKWRKFAELAAAHMATVQPRAVELPEPFGYVPPKRDDEFHHDHASFTGYYAPTAGWPSVYTSDQVHQLLAAERQKSQDVLTLARGALWICAEHAALHFSKRHNTAIQANAAIAAIDKQLAESLAKEATPLMDKDGNNVGLKWDRALSDQEVKAVSDFAIRESKEQS